MHSPFFILLDLDPKQPLAPQRRQNQPSLGTPPLPEIEAAAAAPPELLDEDDAPAAPVPLWGRILGGVIYFAIELLWEFISTPG